MFRTTNAHFVRQPLPVQPQPVLMRACWLSQTVQPHESTHNPKLSTLPVILVPRLLSGRLPSLSQTARPAIPTLAQGCFTCLPHKFTATCRASDQSPHKRKRVAAWPITPINESARINAQTKASLIGLMRSARCSNQRSPELDTCIPKGTLHNMLIQPTGQIKIN